MSNIHPHGEAIKVVNFIDDKLEVDGSKLDALLLNNYVSNRKIVVFTIVGAFRKGKSFFLDYCLRYMYANVSYVVSIKKYYRYLN